MKKWQSMVAVVAANVVLLGGLVVAAAPSADAGTKHPYPGHVIAEGSNDHDSVKLIQRRLHIKADGIFGHHTKASVKKFQHQFRLDVDGIVGQKTWRVMFSGVYASSSITKKKVIKKGDKRYSQGCTNPASGWQVREPPAPWNLGHVSMKLYVCWNKKGKIVFSRLQTITEAKTTNSGKTSFYSIDINQPFPTGQSTSTSVSWSADGDGNLCIPLGIPKIWTPIKACGFDEEFQVVANYQSPGATVEDLDGTKHTLRELGFKEGLYVDDARCSNDQCHLKFKRVPAG